MRVTLTFIGLLLTANLFAKGLTINAAEIGIGKFHRHDNKQHMYENQNAWSPYILPEGEIKNLPYVKEVSSDTVTIFFDTLEGLLKQMVKIANDRNEKVVVMNINAHGLPGGMWFPATEKIMNSWSCMQWKQAAQGGDEGNYNQYYSAVSKEDIMQLREYSKTGGNMPCVTSGTQWKTVVATIPGMKEVFADGARVNLLSCLVGLGPVGDKFTKELAQILFGETKGSVRTSIKLGLGDWSMPEGMGFWDYIDDEQLAKDNAVYPVNKKDRDIMQKGPVRVASLDKGQWGTKVVEGLDFMSLDGAFDSGFVVPEPVLNVKGIKPSRLRIPGTSQYVEVQ